MDQDQTILFSSALTVFATCIGYKLFRWYRVRQLFRKKQSLLVEEEDHFIV